MKVSELIAQLHHEDPNAEVHFSYNYGDHWRTQVAPKVRRIKVCPIEHSEYHSMPRVLDEEHPRADTAATAVVLY